MPLCHVLITKTLFKTGPTVHFLGAKTQAGSLTGSCILKRGEFKYGNFQQTLCIHVTTTSNIVPYRERDYGSSRSVTALTFESNSCTSSINLKHNSQQVGRNSIKSCSLKLASSIRKHRDRQEAS